jgi:hypothetical protein
MPNGKSDNETKILSQNEDKKDYPSKISGDI